VGLSPTFVALILLPIVGNAAEHFSAVTVAMKNKLDLSVGIAVGSSVQIAVFVTPLMVLMSNFVGPRPMTMTFSVFEVVVLVLSVMSTSTMLKDSKASWLEGVLLLGGYVIAGAGFWFMK